MINFASVIRHSSDSAPEANAKLFF